MREYVKAARSIFRDEIKQYLANPSRKNLSTFLQSKDRMVWREREDEPEKDRCVLLPFTSCLDCPCMENDEYWRMAGMSHGFCHLSVGSEIVGEPVSLTVPLIQKVLDMMGPE